MPTRQRFVHKESTIKRSKDNWNITALEQVQRTSKTQRYMHLTYQVKQLQSLFWLPWLS